jgi:hypothetical protein
MLIPIFRKFQKFLFRISIKYFLENLFIFLLLGNIFLLPISISLACYLAIYADLIRMQRRFSLAFKRHVHIRKNLISQILFLFLNFAVFWLPAEIIMLYIKNRKVKDAAQVTKSLNILLDPLIIIGFDTRFSSAARQLLSIWPFNPFMRCFNINRQYNSSLTTQTIIEKRPKRSYQTSHQQRTRTSTWNIANNDDITVLESVSNYSLQNQKTKRQQKRLKPSVNQRQSRTNRRHKATKKRMKIAENHV